MESGSKLVKLEYFDKQVQEESAHGSMQTISFEEAVERERQYDISRKLRFSQASCGTGLVPPSQSSIGFGKHPASSHGAEMDLKCQNPMTMRLSHSSIKIEPDDQTPTERDTNNQNPIEMMFKQPTVLLEFLPTYKPSVKEEPYYQTPTEKDAEYQKPIDTEFKQRAVASGFPVTSKGGISARQRPPRAPETSCKPHIPEVHLNPVVGIKRKADSQSQLLLPTRELYGRQLPLLNQDRQKTSPQPHFPHNSPQFQYQHPHSTRPQTLPLLNSQPLPSQTQQNHKPPPQQPKHPHQSPDQHPSSSNAGALWWCSVCEIPCMNVNCFEQHLEGKKHRAKLEASASKDNGKKWCQECNIMCVNEFSWDQHRNGKKHAARLLELQRGYK